MDKIFTDKKIKEIENTFALGASKTEVCVECGIDKVDLARWLSVDGNDERMKDLRIKYIWNAKKIFNQPKDHKEAEVFLKRHPETKTDYSDRVDLNASVDGTLNIKVVNFSNGN